MPSEKDAEVPRNAGDVGEVRGPTNPADPLKKCKRKVIETVRVQGHVATLGTATKTVDEQSVSV